MSNQPLQESETVELKKSLAELKQGLVSMAAILNKHQAGTLWFGVRNNGTITGIDANEKTLREAIINAFCHRDYYDPDFIQMAIFKDRVEIRNPGKLYGTLTIDDSRKGNISQRRNPLIADLFRRIEMVEAWGRGMPLIIKNAPDVVFREIGNLFIVAFNRPSFFEKPGEGTIQKEPPTSHKTSQKTIHKELFATEKAVIEIIKKHPSITRKELAARLNLSEAGVRYNTDKLQTKGILRRVGGKKAGRWEVIDGGFSESEGDVVGGGDG